MKSQERQLFDLCLENVGEHFGISIVQTAILMDGRESIRVYQANGYCFDSSREYGCEPSEVGQFQDVDEDGNSYSFFSEYEGFKPLSIDEAIKLMESLNRP